MRGYRDHSFDPNAGSSDSGAPLPRNDWVQWTGAAIALIGVAIDLVYLGGRMGITRQYLDSPSIGVGLPLIGAALISSRRQPRPSPETKRQRLIVIALGLAIAALAVAAVIYFKGAR